MNDDTRTRAPEDRGALRNYLIMCAAATAVMAGFVYAAVTFVNNA